jgi:metal-responsive CopG/Arc/MetJ family transcriptional regulator
MKTAISIPDSVYYAAEQLASRLGESRSELYSKAVDAYIKQHHNVKVTEKLNDVYEKNPKNFDSDIETMQKRMWLKRNSW